MAIFLGSFFGTFICLILVGILYELYGEEEDKS